MRTLELLAPAKNLECGIAAIDHGADAVYIGADRYGARAAAGNSLDDIAQLCRHAHMYGAKVYVTLNTIIYDSELADTMELVHRLVDIGVDALLVQDMGLAAMCRGIIPLHASTQCDTRTAEKASWLHTQGMQRVVLARELSIEEIRTIHMADPSLQLEVFVHGALCVSYSGLCYASQHCFARSANRGECAQFCRMKFDLVDAEGKEIIHQKHLLSLKDMCRIDYLEQLADAGACSFKIEGRLKDVAYVKNVVSAYSQRLDKLVASRPDDYCRASAGRVEYLFTPNLDKTFNRGFTTYFLNGRQRDIASFYTPKALGEYVGTVKEIRSDSFNVAGTASFANGDGLCFINADNELEGFRVNRAVGNRLFPLRMPETLKPGMALYRNHDVAFGKILSSVTSRRKIPVTMRLEKVTEGYALYVNDRLAATIEMQHQTAQKPQAENIIKQLTKLGNTPYECTVVTLGDGVADSFIPSSLLTDIRRRAIEAYSLMTSQTDTTIASQTEVPTVSIPHNIEWQPDYVKYPYTYNISNEEASRFYSDMGMQSPAKAFELSTPSSTSLLMQCRHCLRHALGHCTKRGDKAPSWIEPLYLRLADGRCFRLQFNCGECVMKVFTTRLMLLCFMFISLLSSCYHKPACSTEHHYSNNYNFKVKADTLYLYSQEPEEMLSTDFVPDSFVVLHGEMLAVADIRVMPADSIDSVWVQLATVQSNFGWSRESRFLPLVVPADPISQFISFFSDVHLIIFLVVIGVIAVSYWMRFLLRQKAPLVHVRDIRSFYPTLLALLVAVSASYYAYIQTFHSEMWRNFYFHPTLNPFALPLVLSVFLVMVWSLLIVGLAVVDDVRHQLPFSDAVLYLSGLLAVCAANYIVFSLTSLYYIGYVLLILYITYALRRYFLFSYFPYRCGKCGEPMQKHGKCPKCGAENDV